MALTKVDKSVSSTPGIVDNSDATAITITSAEKVGIGTTDPSQILNVQSATFPVVEIANYSDNNPTDGAALDLIEKQPSYASATNTFGQTGVYGYRIKLNGSDNTLRIKSGSQTTVTDRITLERDTGNVGIGETAPLGKVHIKSGDTGASSVSGDKSDLVVENNSHAGITTLSTDSTESGIFFGHTSDTRAGEIYTRYDTTLMTIGTRMSGGIVKFLSGNGSERMRIQSGGGIIVGGTSTGGTVAAQIEANGGDSGRCFQTTVTGTGSANAITFNNGNGQIGRITTSGSATSYVGTSDYRMKENIVYDWNAMTKVKNLKPAQFNFKTNTDEIVEGFIAHEAQSVVPYAVVGEKDGEEMQGMDYGKLTAILTKAIQEQQAIIEDLKARIEVLEA